MHMARTLTICSWLLVALGAAVTIGLIPHPIMFLPYIFLGLASSTARRLPVRAFVLALTLASVCVGFRSCWDAAYIHRSTLNFWPLNMVIVESLLAWVAWGVVRRIESNDNKSQTQTPPSH